MAKTAVDLDFGGLSSYAYPADYDASELGLGSLMVQRNTGGEGSYVGPLEVGVARPVEASTSIPGVYPWVRRDGNTNIDWVFLADNAAAAATRRIVFYKYNRSTAEFSWQGYVTLTFPTGTNHTIRGFRMTYDTYSTGTVEVSGTSVTGSGTAWQTARFAVGARIGFGSTDPTAISTWYDISAIGSDTGITLSTSAGTIGSGTAFVIEELRAILLNTNATATNGGLFVVKGLNAGTFATGGTAIGAAVSTDNVRAVYWLADAGTVTNTTGAGLAIQDKDSNTQHYCWALNGTTTSQLFKYNLRAALSLSSGKDTANAIQFATGVTATLTGTASQANNGRLATLNHGPGSGESCIYFTTGSRIYRTNDVSSITTGVTNYLADVAVEVPPGGTNTFAVTGALNSVEHAGTIDKLVVLSSGAAGIRSYITEFRTDSGQWDRIFLVDNKQIDQSIADSGTTPMPSILARAFTGWSEAGILYLAGVGTTATTNLLYALPISADWTYSSLTDSVIVTPELVTPNNSSFSRVFVNSVNVLGGGGGQGLGVSPEPWRIAYRTSGISDNSGSWTDLDSDNDLRSVTGAGSIQFKFEFRTIGQNCVPGRVLGLSVVYEDLNTDSHYQPSVKHSDRSTKAFAWRFSTAFGGSVPDLRVRLYDAVSGTELVDDDTATPSGTFERSTNDGGAWSSWNNTDKANDTTYLRYTPASLGDNIRVRALLTLL